MHYRIDSLRGPNSLNSSFSKALFYIFHVFPEWLAIFILFSQNARKTFGTGLFGDWRVNDETEMEGEKRLLKQAAKEAKKGISMGGDGVREKQGNEKVHVTIQANV